MQTIPIMFDRITTMADELRDLFGDRALREAEARLEEAALWGDHKAAALYADVCSELQHDGAKAAKWKPRGLMSGWLALVGLGTRNSHGSKALFA